VTSAGQTSNKYHGFPAQREKKLRREGGTLESYPELNSIQVNHLAGREGTFLCHISHAGEKNIRCLNKGPGETDGKGRSETPILLLPDTEEATGDPIWERNPKRLRMTMFKKTTIAAAFGGHKVKENGRKGNFYGGTCIKRREEYSP